MIRTRFFHVTIFLLTVLICSCVFFVHTNRFRLTRFWRSGVANADLRILVLTLDDPQSLKRLLNSLNEAFYYNDNIVVEIWIDRNKNGSMDLETVRVAQSFEFRHGKVRTYNQSVSIGIGGQWLTSWQPAMDSSEMALILKDDLTVSPYFYKYLKAVHSKYGHRPDINGFSLQGISIKHDGQPGYLDVPRENPVFLYPTIGTWGFSPDRENWFQFVAWFLEMRSNTDGFKPLVPNHMTSQWYEQFEAQGRADLLWEIWHIHHAWKNSLLTLYPNCLGHKEGFTFNWSEGGSHGVEKKDQEKSGLVQKWDARFETLPEKPVILNNGGEIVN